MQNNDDKNTGCKRCGDCCRNGGPALHEEDMNLIQDGTIPLTDIVTLRVGERAYDQVTQTVTGLDAEILKIKGRDGKWTCTYYSPEGRTCGMYDSRPVECELLYCEDTAPLAQMYDKGRLTREHLLPEGHPLLELIAEHNQKCDPVRMEELGKAAREGDDASGEALREMVLFDMEMRRLVPEKAGTPAEMNDFFFGRPLKVLLRSMNINTYEVGDTIRFGFTG